MAITISVTVPDEIADRVWAGFSAQNPNYNYPDPAAGYHAFVVEYLRNAMVSHEAQTALIEANNVAATIYAITATASGTDATMLN